MAHEVAQLAEALRHKPEGRGFDSRQVHWDFSYTQPLRQHYGPEVDSVSNRNECQGHLLERGGGVKAIV
jgi:hypothetical protein